MKLNTLQYSKMLSDHNISVIYSGPIWASGIDGMAEMLLKRLEFEEIPMSASQSVFSIFVEQMNNMLMYSAQKSDREELAKSNGKKVSIGVFILGIQDDEYFIQTGNAVTPYSAEILKTRIDHLNTLDKKEMRQYYKQQMKSENDNPESKGAGIGLIEIARRSTTPIEYHMEPYDGDLQYFTMYIRIKQGGKENAISA